MTAACPYQIRMGVDGWLVVRPISTGGWARRRVRVSIADVALAAIAVVVLWAKLRGWG